MPACSVQAIVDMPDRDIDLFIRFCLQNDGRLSQRRRESHFTVLTDDEIQQLEHAVEEGFGRRAGGRGQSQPGAGDL